MTVSNVFFPLNLNPDYQRSGFFMSGLSALYMAFCGKFFFIWSDIIFINVHKYSTLPNPIHKCFIEFSMLQALFFFNLHIRTEMRQIYRIDIIFDILTNIHIL